jgi:hypothetical protein
VGVAGVESLLRFAQFIRWQGAGGNVWFMTWALAVAWHRNMGYLESYHDRPVLHSMLIEPSGMRDHARSLAARVQERNRFPILSTTRTKDASAANNRSPGLARKAGSKRRPERARERGRWRYGAPEGGLLIPIHMYFALCSFLHEIGRAD